MLKIEVIKFEAMDVITASVATPEVDAEEKPAEVVCTCNPNPEPGNDYYACSQNGHFDCPVTSGADADHNCPDYIA